MTRAALCSQSSDFDPGVSANGSHVLLFPMSARLVVPGNPVDFSDVTMLVDGAYATGPSFGASIQ